MTTIRHHPSAVVRWTGALATLVALAHLDTGGLAAPPLTDLDGAARWLAARDPVTAAMAVLRLCALVAAGYLVIVGVLVAIARGTRHRRLAALAEALTLPAAARALGVAGGIGLAAVAARVAAVDGPPAPAAAVATHGAAPVLERLPDTGPDGPEADPEPDADTPAIRRLGDEPPAAPLASIPGEWEVRPGDHLWAIARAHLAGSWGRAPTDAEVVPHWRDLISANRGRLVDPDDPDLIHPGQRMRLPTAPPLPPRVADGPSR